MSVERKYPLLLKPVIKDYLWGYEEKFPILIKLIDAKDRLSVQVHPDNTYALENEVEYGKTDMWYVIDCEEGAQLIYGFNKKI